MSEEKNVNGNYIKVYRSLRDPGCWVRKRTDWLGIWMDILLKAAWTDYGDLKRGEFYWEPKKDWPDVPEWVIKRFMEAARKENEIVRSSKGYNTRSNAGYKPTIYLVVNYDKYQGKPESEGKAQGRTQGRTQGKANPAEPLGTTDSGCHKKERSKEVNKNIVGSHQQVVDYIWTTYKDKYLVEPPKDKAFFANIARLTKQYGPEKMTKAWDRYLASDDPFFSSKQHPPQMFVKASIIIQFLTEHETPSEKRAREDAEYAARSAELSRSTADSLRQRHAAARRAIESSEDPDN